MTKKQEWRRQREALERVIKAYETIQRDTPNTHPFLQRILNTMNPDPKAFIAMLRTEQENAERYGE